MDGGRYKPHPGAGRGPSWCSTPVLKAEDEAPRRRGPLQLLTREVPREETQRALPSLVFFFLPLSLPPPRTPRAPSDCPPSHPKVCGWVSNDANGGERGRQIMSLEVLGGPAATASKKKAGTETHAA